jgi:glycosyltransferase involved in cell wall biosynthesis
MPSFLTVTRRYPHLPQQPELKNSSFVTVMQQKPRLLRITTVPISLKLLLEGQVNFFKQAGFEVLTVSADGSEVQELRALGIKHKVVSMTRSITPLRDLIAVVQLIQVIRKFKPHIVHTHTPKAGLLGMIAAWMCRVPVRMHTVAGLPVMEATGVKRKILLVTERITYACASKVYPNSKGLLDFIQSTFARYFETKFKIIGKGSSNGIDTTFFSRSPELEANAKAIREKYEITEDAIVFSFVGRLVRDKGLVELVEAFKKLTIPSRLLLVGPFENHLDPLPDEAMKFLQTDSRVILAGFQHDVRPWMMASDVFVFPSYREGFPNVVMQAACLELPVIASDINGCNEILQHEQTGLLVPVKNTEALHTTMLELASNSAKRKKLAEQSRAFVVNHFERKYVWSELLKEYNTHLTRHS